MAAWDSSRLRQARLAAGLSQGDVRARLAKIRRRKGMPPKESSLKRMYTDWEQGRVFPADWIDELCEAFELPKSALGLDVAEPAPLPTTAVELPTTLDVLRLDGELVSRLEDLTNHYRQMDRQVGAALIPQTVAHVEHLQRLLRNALPGQHTDAAAIALAEAAALAGWQALDAGDITQCWNLHDVAKLAAKQGDNPAVLAHVTAQQAYALLDAGRPADAVELMRYASTPDAIRRIPARLRAWLAAAEGEALATLGDEVSARHQLDRAAQLLPAGDVDEELPYLMLNETHLARWRGNCLATLGADEAVDYLAAAVNSNQQLTSARAEASLRADLAEAFRNRGDLAESQQQATRAHELASRTGSHRQRRRIAKLISA